jgi:type IV pilus assembly protein PilV
MIIRSPGRRAGGFSMIEVLIALVVLAIGLLGLALLQTMNLRYTKNAQQRTLAVNLAGELLDTMRANRSEIEAYAMTEADFAAVDPGTGGCNVYDALTSANNVTRWQCEVREALGPEAWAEVDVGDAPEVEVTINWDVGSMPAVGDDDGEVTLGTTL